MKKKQAIRIALEKLRYIDTKSMRGVDVIELGHAERILHEAIITKHKDCRHCGTQAD